MRHTNKPCFFCKMKPKWKMIATFSLFFKLFNMSSVEGKIECHFCGIEDTCTLPYIITSSSKTECNDSCMKFDGKDPGGKRVVVRSCGTQNSTKCFINEKWNKAVGEICYCNSVNCNLATTRNFINPFLIWMSYIIIFSTN